MFHFRTRETNAKERKLVTVQAVRKMCQILSGRSNNLIWETWKSRGKLRLKRSGNSDFICLHDETYITRNCPLFFYMSEYLFFFFTRCLFFVVIFHICQEMCRIILCSIHIRVGNGQQRGHQHCFATSSVSLSVLVTVQIN